MIFSIILNCPPELLIFAIAPGFNLFINLNLFPAKGEKNKNKIEKTNRIWYFRTTVMTDLQRMVPSRSTSSKGPDGRRSPRTASIQPNTSASNCWSRLPAIYQKKSVCLFNKIFQKLKILLKGQIHPKAKKNFSKNPKKSCQKEANCKPGYRYSASSRPHPQTVMPLWLGCGWL